MNQVKILICGFCTEDRIDGKSYFGGAAGGIALNLASFHIPVGIVSVLGEDEFSKRYLAEFRKRKVKTELLSISATRLPHMTVINRENTEYARKFEDNGVKELLAKLKPDTSLLNHYGVLHAVNTPRLLCDYLAAHFQGDISYCPGSLFIREPDSLSMNLLNKSNFLFCNEAEYMQLTRTLLVHDLFKKRLQLVCVSFGERGVRLITKSGEKTLKVRLASYVIDTTGAGDAIVVGFLKGYVQGFSYEESIQEGLQLASRIIQKKGVVLSE